MVNISSATPPGWKYLDVRGTLLQAILFILLSSDISVKNDFGETTTCHLSVFLCIHDAETTDIVHWTCIQGKTLHGQPSQKSRVLPGLLLLLHSSKKHWLFNQ